MGDIMPEKRNSILYKILDWLDRKTGNIIKTKCAFCGKEMILTLTEFEAANEEPCCSDRCAKTVLR
jgi:hypothetical protein